MTDYSYLDYDADAEYGRLDADDLYDYSECERYGHFSDEDGTYCPDCGFQFG
jgi:hypothetical protein